MKITEFLGRDGHSPFQDWFDHLDTQAAAKVTTAITRMGQGNMSGVKSVGGGLYERKIDFGPGYRIYFGKEGDRIIILIGGGTKRRQSKDIQTAKVRWSEYKKWKKEGN